MTFKHKLSSRLALLKDRVVLASLAGLVTAAIVACELPVRATDPGSTIADLLVSPKTLTLRQNATADFTAVGFMSTGDSASVAVSWSVTAGSIIDTSSNGKRHYGHYKAGPNPGQFKVVATGSPGGVSDTAVVTVTVAPGNDLPGRGITWSRSSLSVASVNGSGLVTGAGAGSATITATSEGQSGTSGVTVTFVPVASVTVNPASASVQVGQTVQLSATPRDANGNALPGRTVTWASTNTTVATVNGQGLVTAKVVGSATITATSEGQSGSAAITVTAAPVATVTVSPAAAAVQPGQTVQLTATTKDANGNILTGRTVTWASNSNPAATVSSSGLVTGVATGTALITATSEGQSGGAAIAVGTPPPPAGCAPTGGGRCYYVDAAAGNDGNPGDSARPLRTVQHAADLVNPGDMVIVRDGVYTGSSSEVLAIGRGGTASNWVVFRAEHKWGAVLDGQGTPGVQGVSDAGVHFSASFVRVEGFEIRGMWHDGVDMGATDIVLSGNHIHNVGGYCESSGLGISAIAAYSSNVVIEQNVIHDIGRLSPGQFGCSPSSDYWQNHDHGIYLSDGVNVIIRNNVFYNMVHGWDVHRYGSTCDQVYVVNNTFAYPNPNRDGHIILASTTTNLYIENNIFYLPGQNIGISGTTSGAHIDHNLSTAAVGGGGIGDRKSTRLNSSHSSISYA